MKQVLFRVIQVYVVLSLLSAASVAEEPISIGPAIAGFSRFSDLTISPNSEMLAYVESNFGDGETVFIHTLDFGGDSVEIAGFSASDDRVQSLEFLIDSSALLILTNNGNLYIRDVVGGELVKINEAELVRDYEVSHSGVIAISTESGLYSFRSTEQGLDEVLLGDFAIVDFIPGSDSLRVILDESCLSISIGTAQSQAYHDCRGVINPQGTLIQYIERETSGTISDPNFGGVLSRSSKYFSKPTAGGDSHQFYSNVTSIGVGLFTAFTTVPNPVRLSADLTVAVVVDGPNRSFGNTPMQGKLTLFSTTDESNLVLSDSASERGFGDYGVSTDKAKVIFTSAKNVTSSDERQYELFTQSVRAGAVARRINTPLDTFGTVSKFLISSDSKRVVYVANPDDETSEELYSVPIDGGVSAPLINIYEPNREIVNYRLTPDSAYLVFESLLHQGTRDEEDDIAQLFKAKLPSLASNEEVCFPIKSEGNTTVITICL